MRKKRKLKNKFKKIFKLLFVFIIIITFLLLIYKTQFKKYIKNITFNNNILTIDLIENNDLYCILSNDIPSLDSDNWIKSVNNQCIINYNNESNLYIKNNNKIVYSTLHDMYYKLKDIKTIYMVQDDKYYLFDYFLGNYDYFKIKINNNDLIKYENGYIKSINTGNTSYSIKDNNEITYNVNITEIISKRPTIYNDKREFLSCNQYSKEDNDLIDNLLSFRVRDVGYKTRAGVVEAARFLTLDLPYKINYFYENGRLGTNKVDGEGRYYHKGLYLDESRIDNLSGSSSLKNRGNWGCSLYSVPEKGNMDNGLDCSGFISWALLNGGFDPGDIGAGFTKKKNLTDLGELKKITDELALNGTIKVGDLLHNEKAGGHIAIIVGIDNDYYYVAQAIWFDEVGVVISKIEKDKLDSEFPHVVLMDKYYKNDGKLTNMW